MNKCAQENGKVPRCGRKQPLPEKFCRGHHQENFAAGRGRTSKILPPMQKLGRGSRKRKGTKVWHGNADKSLPLQFGTKTHNYKSVKMIINYGG
jgi:hypothetical protein